jgi:glutamine amidotransferase
MCRFYGFRANEATKVECTLVHAQNALLIQSRLDRSGSSHTDGWGVGFYHDREPEVERRASAAHEDLHFSATAERVYSKTVIAHVRQATVGGPSVANSHPFCHGVWLFAHNGTLEAFDQVQPLLERETDAAYRQVRQGVTDSEAIFVWLLGRMAAAGIGLHRRCPDSARLVAVVRDAVRQLVAWSDAQHPDEPSKLNFLLTDGATLVATRLGRSLFWVRRNGIRDCEICGIPHVHHDSKGTYRAVVVASEPISHESWEEVPDGTILSIDGKVKTALAPI